MAAALPLLFEGPPREGWVLVPSPLSAARLRTRGYNQSALLARGVSRSSGLPIAWRMLDRIRDDGPQAGRSRRERARIRGSFRAHAAEGARVVLLDDVTTTGETLMACAEALRAAGARTVCALCLAWADGTQPSS
jgi:ComF family protein